MTEKEKKAGAKRFAEAWANRGDEKQETQVFWLSLLNQVFGVADPMQHIQFEKRAIKVESGKCRVKSEGNVNSSLPTPHSTPHSIGFIDAYLPATSVLIEQKSSDVDLRKVQPSGLTPYQQARQYAAALPFSERPRWIVTCNFREFLVYDQEKPTAEPESILLKNLPKEYYRLAFLVEEKSALLHREEEVSIKAGEIVGKLYDALLKQYADPDDKGTLHSLNVLCVRLVFCLYAEDAGIFGARNQFADYLRRFPPCDVRRALLDLFRILDTPVADRDRYEDPALLAFPYVNGGLFSLVARDGDVAFPTTGVELPKTGMEFGNATSPSRALEVPQFTQEIVDILLHRASEDFDWSQISPTIFGAVFESTLNPETRRKGGMHYTSIENIHKVIDPLFLDDLKAELAEIKTLKQPKAIESQVAAFTRRLASLTFLDPACGSGNFLTETYLSLRRLENDALRLVYKWGGLDLGGTIQVQLNQFYGIEINDFAVTVAKTALWIAESQMMTETAEILGRTLDFLPLKSYTGIVEGNALRMDWGEPQRRKEAEAGGASNPVIASKAKQSTYDYIIGNPPFVGHQYRSQEQVDDMDFVFADFGNYGKLDYVASWYKKAVDFMRGTKTRAVFVSTNSLVQGESVSTMWEPLFNNYGLEIDFAHRTFQWDSEANLKAHVHCVIIGFSTCLAARDGDVAFPTTGERPSKTGVGVSTTGVEQLSTVGVELGNATSPSRATKRQKLIFTDGKAQVAANINGYLLDAPNVFIKNRSSVSTIGLPKMTKGSQPTDGGNLFLSESERKLLVEKYPNAAKFIKRFIGAEEFINNGIRYCLWLKDVSPHEYRNIPEIQHRLEAIRKMRLASPTKSVQRDADTPMLFTQIRQPNSAYLVVPRHSSERRMYIPIGFIQPDVIVGDACSIIPDVTLYHFGVLTSSVHMAWMRVVCGRLKSDYRYTPAVYNNFPWPEAVGSVSRPYQSDAPLVASVSPKRSDNPANPENPCDKISETAQAILDIRARYPDASLADLYDPLTMPPDLRKAHRANDAAVLAAYGLSPDIPEPALVAHLMSLYQKLSATLGNR